MEPEELASRFRAVRRSLDETGAELETIRGLNHSGVPLDRQRVSAWHEWCERVLPDLDHLMDELIAISTQLMRDDIEVELRQEFAGAMDALDGMRRSLAAGRDVLAAALRQTLPGDER